MEVCAVMRRLLTTTVALAGVRCTLLAPSDAELRGPTAIDAQAPPDAPMPSQNDAGPPDADADGAADAGDPTLVAWWTFDETTGATAHDATGHGYDVTLLSASFAAGGHSGNCLVLDLGGTAKVDALGGLAFPRSGTLSIWFKFDSLPDDTSERRIFDGNSPGRAHIFVRHANNTAAGLVGVAHQREDGSYALGQTFTPTPSKWIHVVTTWDEGAQTGKLYVDGSMLGGVAYSPAFVPTGQLVRFGGNFTGWIDDVKIWSRVLPQSEVAQL
jgi:hypothetical protein